jgi:hypothetical protein
MLNTAAQRGRSGTPRVRGCDRGRRSAPWDTRDARVLLVRPPRTEGHGVYEADLNLIAHHDVRHSHVGELRRVYDCSKRGRCRPRREVLALLKRHLAAPDGIA